MTTGNIGYAVNSFTQLGQDKFNGTLNYKTNHFGMQEVSLNLNGGLGKGFNGTLNYKTNHFGMQEVSLNLNGGLGKGWLYSASMYQDFDPGTFDIKATPFQDRTQIYKFAITKKYNNDRGAFTALYNFSKSHPVYTFATQSAPFVYVGDGSVLCRRR